METDPQKQIPEHKHIVLENFIPLILNISFFFTFSYYVQNYEFYTSQHPTIQQHSLTLKNGSVHGGTMNASLHPSKWLTVAVVQNINSDELKTTPANNRGNNKTLPFLPNSFLVFIMPRSIPSMMRRNGSPPVLLM